jgi:ankyrin repeat protein
VLRCFVAARPAPASVALRPAVVHLGVAKSRSLRRAKAIALQTEDTLGFTPLHHAARNGHASIVSLLLERGADKEAKAKVRCGLRDRLPRLPSAHSSRRTRARCSVRGETPTMPLSARLSTLSSFSTLEAADAFALRCAMVAVRHTQWDFTALNWAANAGHLSVVSLLLECGADKQTKDHVRCAPCVCL